MLLKMMLLNHLLVLLLKTGLRPVRGNLCTEKSTGKIFACKSISKKKLVTKADKEDMRREIQIMQHLSGQPNIVEFKGAYEDEKAVKLVMELCAGGELFDRILAKGHYSERAAASVCRQNVNVVNICVSWV